MNNTDYDKDKLIRYLLGTLPEDATERLDELSFTSDDLARDLEAAENELVDGFIAGELAPAEAELFRSNYLATPLRRRKVEFARALQRMPTPDKIVDRASSGFFSQLRAFFAGSGLRIAFSAAAAVLLVVAGVWIISSRREPVEQAAVVSPSPDQPISTPDPITPTPTIGRDEEREPEVNLPRTTDPTPAPTKPKPERAVPTVATLVLTPTMRGAGSPPTLEIEPGMTQIVVRLQLEADEFKQYTVTLANESGRNVWSGAAAKAQKAGGQSSISVRVPADRIEPQFHTFVVSGVTATGSEPIGSYSFRAMKR